MNLGLFTTSNKKPINFKPIPSQRELFPSLLPPHRQPCRLLPSSSSTTLYAFPQNPNHNTSIPPFFFIKFKSSSFRTLISLPLCRSLPVSASLPAPSTTVDASRARCSPFLLTGSTRTLSSLLSLTLAVSLSVSKFLHARLLPQLSGLFPSPADLASLRSVGGSLSSTVGPALFAALKSGVPKDRPSGYLNTPLTVVAAGLAKWLDIYSGVLMVRVLLSWFPNIPWERQPLSAIRDLCDPYLNLFRNIIPPIFDTLDVSPLLAFAVLGTLGSILNSSRGMY